MRGPQIVRAVCGAIVLLLPLAAGAQKSATPGRLPATRIPGQKTITIKDPEIPTYNLNKKPRAKGASSAKASNQTVASQVAAQNAMLAQLQANSSAGREGARNARQEKASKGQGGGRRQRGARPTSAPKQAKSSGMSSFSRGMRRGR